MKIKTLFFSAACSFGFAYLITKSIFISSPYGLFGSALPILILRQKQEKRRKKIEALWSEILDIIISGILSGLSLPSTLASLSQRGPKEVRPYFQEFHDGLKDELSFSVSLKRLRSRFNTAQSDLVFEILEFARSSGARDTALLLRTLSDFTRADIQLRKEIDAKQSWIKNSGVLAASAPWFLLLLLSRSPNAISAYTSKGGVIILIFGVILTFLAFLWMNITSKSKVEPRVFMNQVNS